MKKILIISGGVFPVPAVNGGAVESLIEMAALQNEKSPAFFMEIVSRDDPKISESTVDYQYAKFHFISYPLRVQAQDAINYWYMEKIRHDWRSMFARNKEKSKYYARQLAEQIPLSEYDKIIVENNMSLLEPVAKKLGDRFSEKCYYHMHSVLVDNPAMIPYLARCRKILVVSDYVKRELYQSVPQFSETIIEKVVNGICEETVPEEQWQEERRRLRKQYHLTENEKVFLYCGRLSPEKGPMELIKAFCQVKDSQAVLVVAGSCVSGKNEKNGYVKQLLKLAEAQNSRIHFTGYIPHENMGSYYRMADVLVVPSVVGDAAPLTVLEGMAAGIDLIASRVGGIPEYTETYGPKTLVEQNENFIDNLKEAMENYLKGDFREKGRQEQRLFSDRDFFKEFVHAVAD